jgi:hypothetical protein
VIASSTASDIEFSKIAYKAALPPSDLQTVRFLLKLFQIIKKYAVEDKNNFCSKILVEASHSESC